MRSRLLSCLFVLVLLPSLRLAATPQPQTSDGIDRLIARLDQAFRAGDERTLRAQAAPDAEPSAVDAFVASLGGGPPTHATVKLRDRQTVASGRERLLVEIFVDRQREGRVSTWRLDVERTSADTDVWRIAAFDRESVVSGLYRLALDPAKEFDVHDLTLHAPDFTIDLPAGRAFTASTPDGPTAIVLLGNGRMTFSPGPAAERGQVRLFCGRDSLETDFEAVFVRLNPYEFASQVPKSAFVPRDVSEKDLTRARGIFDASVGQSFQIDLMDLSEDQWSLVPSGGDFVAEVVTKKYGTLTYARATSEQEDVTLFDRRRHKNISVYASIAKMGERGRFYSEDAPTDYDVLSYDIDASFDPSRDWIDGNARLRLMMRHPASTLTLRLAEPLVVRGVYAPAFGRLLHLRVVGQNSVLVSLPDTLLPDDQLELRVVYGGRLAPQGVDREALSVSQQAPYEVQMVPLEPKYLYSNRSLWYPQATVTDYATAVMRITVPQEYDVVASGIAAGGPTQAPPAAGDDRPRVQFVFTTNRPARYLACVITRFASRESTRLSLTTTEAWRVPENAPATDGADGLALTVRANPRQTGRVRGYAERAADILEFYTSLLGEVPYPAFTVAITDSDLPGGHSPAYFAVLNQPAPMSPFVWRNDPVAFENYPSFFLAHEIAHQWWGQAIGWKNYHEQWISEGFAQYFAALYAERERGPDEFATIMRQMSKWGRDTSDQGPVYLGYRLGHIKSEPRVFRALVYNKAAAVLHMLRQLVGDGPFFAGVREFYTTWRYRKAGTDDFRLSMEAASGRSLSAFFDDWIYGDAVPRVKFSSSVNDERDAVTLRFEQPGTPMELPIEVTFQYRGAPSQTIVVDVKDRLTERTVPLAGDLRKVEVDRRDLAMARIDR
ncbi:MAG TPA: M1 family aminopeptidase [Vicinamibacterales bacterium]|nr:M1 family aminopeptidase [Vicinamibacterales bacterium]